MNPKEFEIMVAKFFKMQGYDTILTPYSGDWGIDVIATKGKEKVAVQAKMYGDSARKVSRLAMMQLYGAMAYQDCTRAVMVTNGECMEDALIVAEKLGIEVVYLDKTPQLVDAEKAIEVQTKAESKPTGIMEFNDVWERYIIPLQGKLLKDGNRANEILKVDWGGESQEEHLKEKLVECLSRILEWLMVCWKEMDLQNARKSIKLSTVARRVSYLFFCKFLLLV